MKSKKLTVTVCISAYNEEKNIIRFLHSVLNQKQVSYALEKILVISDGSDDRTVERALLIKDKRIVVIDHPVRLGKSKRLNELYEMCDTQLLIQSDADTVLARSDTIEKLIFPLLSEKRVAMTGGNPVPFHAKTFVERAVNRTCLAYSEFRQKVRGGNNVFSADGRLLAFKKILYKKAYIPEDMIANDMYMYFFALSRKCEYRFVKEAVVYFRSPQTVKDQIRQNTRFCAAPKRMKRYFPKELVESELRIQKMLYILTVLKYFSRFPYECAFIYCLNSYCKLLSSLSERRMDARWPIAFSTK